MVNKGIIIVDGVGFGIDCLVEFFKEDDEYEVFCKRMMLVYCFWFNFLNNFRWFYY